ncbi:DUF4142 domain-containing protein [Niabella beijingensis]|uniref:DUF4142 domain-containing protein n=1 Tax=Niabella beijingensis TaxID=2872700 RepID=UPI001CBFED5F|nr:DUF4142 domain-containing protein [Niabella beijingensis]MBZ4191285.1 DUF4142 domain-containing protein [Niabella beijingensis]
MIRSVTGIVLISMICTLVIPACGPHRNDQKEKAVAANEAKFKKRNPDVVSATLERDARFAVDAIASGLMEIKWSELAQKNGSEPRVKAFGNSMAAAQQTANNELRRMAASKQITLPDTAVAGARYQQLKSLTGDRFDKDYIKTMIRSQRQNIEVFNRYISAGKDSDLLRWAILKLPALKQHLGYARGVDSILERQRINGVPSLP